MDISSVTSINEHMALFLKARVQRLHFERFAGYSIVIIAIVIIPVGMVSDQLAARVATLAPAIGILATTIGGTLSACWWRGHADNKLMLADQTQSVDTKSTIDVHATSGAGS